MDYEAVVALHSSLMRNVMQLTEQLVAAQERIAELEAQLQSSSNGEGLGRIMETPEVVRG